MQNPAQLPDRAPAWDDPPGMFILDARDLIAMGAPGPFSDSLDGWVRGLVAAVPLPGWFVRWGAECGGVTLHFRSPALVATKSQDAWKDAARSWSAARIAAASSPRAALRPSAPTEKLPPVRLVEVERGGAVFTDAVPIPPRDAAPEDAEIAQNSPIAVAPPGGGAAPGHRGQSIREESKKWIEAARTMERSMRLIAAGAEHDVIACRFVKRPPDLRMPPSGTTPTWSVAERDVESADAVAFESIVAECTFFPDPPPGRRAASDAAMVRRMHRERLLADAGVKFACDRIGPYFMLTDGRPIRMPALGAMGDDAFARILEELRAEKVPPPRPHGPTPNTDAVARFNVRAARLVMAGASRRSDGAGFVKRAGDRWIAVAEADVHDLSDRAFDERVADVAIFGGDKPTPGTAAKAFRRWRREWLLAEAGAVFEHPKDDNPFFRTVCGASVYLWCLEDMGDDSFWDILAKFRARGRVGAAKPEGG